MGAMVGLAGDDDITPSSSSSLTGQVRKSCSKAFGIGITEEVDNGSERKITCMQVNAQIGIGGNGQGRVINRDKDPWQFSKVNHVQLSTQHLNHKQGILSSIHIKILGGFCLHYPVEILRVILRKR